MQRLLRVLVRIPFFALCAAVFIATSFAASPGDPTFHRDIAPIVYGICADCHRPGEAGPFSLLSYNDVKKHSREIVAATQSRFMPPWLPDPGSYPIAGELRLSDAQIDSIRRWVASGMPEGDPKQGPAAPSVVPGWQLGKPDLIVTATKPFLLPATGSDVYWNFIMPVPIEATKWVRAIEIRPGDKRLVHHANILLDRLQTARTFEKQPGAGFGGMELRVESEAFDPDSHLLFWKPGTIVSEQPAGMSLRLDPGTDLLLNTHLQPSGKPESIRPSVGIYFTDHPATLHPMLLELENDSALHIPAGAKQFRVSDTFTLPVPVSLLAIYPHAHYLGSCLEATVTFPNGITKTLLKISHWDLNWQAVYQYAKPVQLPEGARIQMNYVYDNSSENPRNPHTPPIPVAGGNRAQDEMAHLWLQVLPTETAGGDPRLVLQEALSRHQVQKDPTIFEAQYNLAAMLLRRGDTVEAIDHYSAAARIRPQDPVVSNALGAAEMAAGEWAPAVRELRQAAALRPDYFDAHYNLGLALASSNNFADAERELTEAARLKPNDADAHANLGAALAQLGKLPQAQTELQLALRLNPQDQLAQQNLEALQQMMRKN